ncbi:MAG TPA: hypothetical protein DDW65_21420 [Firmicutes bacterium]|nr:hypothetical protein [Bacillota bacterium]
MVTSNPLYIQVKEALLKKIVDGQYIPGDSIPSEPKLAQDFGTSISTIRQAIALLVDEGVLVIKRGKGTFVTTKKNVINFMSWLPETKQGQIILEDLIDLFHKKYSTIQVEIIPTTYSKARKDLVNLISQGSAPDVVQIVSHWTSYLASMGAFTPLEEILSRENLTSRSFEKDLLGGIYKDRLYSVAWGLCPLAIIANREVLAKAGVTQIQQPISIDTFTELCQRVDHFYQSQDKYCFGMCISNEETDFLRMIPFLLAFRGGFVDMQGNVILNSKENIKAFEWLKKFVNSCNVFRSDIFTIRNRFAKGDIAFMIDGPWIKYQLEEITKNDFETNFEVVLNPISISSKSYSWNYNHALAICTQSGKKIQAGKFIDAVTNDAELSYYYFSKTGHLPNNMQHLKTHNYNSNFFNTFKLQLENARAINAQNEMFEKAMRFCINAVEKIFFENVSIEAELNEKAEYLKMLYEE